MKKYKSAVIGCGRIFSRHAVGIQDCVLAELVAICDIKENLAKAMAKEYDCNWYTDYQEMIEQEKPDVVHICLPHYLHAPVAIYCMEKGINILTEKPLAIKLEDAKAMIDTAKKNDVLLGCIFQSRYNAGAALIKEQLDNGALGKVKAAKCFVTWDRSGDYYSKSDWKGTLEKEGGGVIIDQAIHTLDLMRYFVGEEEEIEYIEATIANRGHANIEVEDTAEGVIKYKNGIYTNFHAINYYSYDAPVEIELDCENGRASLKADQALIKFHDGRTMSAERDPRQTFIHGDAKSYWGVTHELQINDYYEALSTGHPLFIPIESAYKTHAMICAIYESGRNNKRVYLNK